MIPNSLNIPLNVSMIQVNNFFNQNSPQNSNSQNQLSNFFSISNINNLSLNYSKIEDENNSDDYFFLPQIPRIKYEIRQEKAVNENISEAKTIYTNFPFTKKKEESFISSNKNLHRTTSLNLKNEFLIEPRLCGNKRNKNNNSIKEHDKYADDNLRRKVKNLIFKVILDFINEKIKNIYEGKIGNGPLKKELFPLNQAARYDITIEFSKNLMYKTLGYIFSGDISTRYSYYLPSHNKEVISILLNDKDDKKRVYFKKLFNIKFIQCIEQFSGKNNYTELHDLKKFDDIKNKFEEYDDEPEYIDKLEQYLKNFEDIIKSKKGKKNKSLKEKEKQ